VPEDPPELVPVHVIVREPLVLLDREVQVLPTMELILERLYMLLRDEVMLVLPGTSRPTGDIQ